MRQLLRIVLFNTDPAAAGSSRAIGLLLSLLLVSLLICITLTGCASIQPSYVTPTGPNNVLHQDSQYTLTAIEFGELGSYADPSGDGLFFTTAAKDSETIANAAKQSGRAAPAPVTMPQAWKIQFVSGHGKYIGIHVPFWIVRVPSDIIDNHGGIWSDNNMALMATIFRMHRPILPNNAVVPAKSFVLPLSTEVKPPSH